MHAYYLALTLALGAAHADRVTHTPQTTVRFQDSQQTPNVEVLPDPVAPAPPVPSFERSAPVSPRSLQYERPPVAYTPFNVVKSGPKYRVRYHHHGRFRRACCGHCEPTKLIIPVEDPIRCGCSVDLCLTVPACLKGYPSVRDRRGLLGRGIVIYDWPCGYMVKVIFKKHVPEAIVHTFAR